MSSEPRSHIYKILRVAEWRAFEVVGRFQGSPDDVRDGFIHFSAGPQVSGTLEKYFAAESVVVILRVCVTPLGDALRWETSRNGALFPHLYRLLRLEEVADVWTVRRAGDGYDLTGLEI